MTTDDVLIRRILQNDRDALAELVERHHRQVYNLALRISGSPEDAEEIAQETFIRVYNSLKTFRFESKFSTWLYRIVSNLAINLLRKRDRRNVSSDGRDIPDTSGNPAREVQRNELREIVRRAILSMPVKYRMIVTLRHLQGFSYDEIADAMEMPVGTVKTYLHRAKTMLKEKLMEMDPSGDLV